MNPEVQPAADAQSFAPPTREELELTARNLVHRFLGNPTGQAEDMVRELTDDELTAIAASALDPASAKTMIKDVFTAAYERKRQSHAEQALADRELLGNRRKAIVVLTRYGMPNAAEHVQHFSTGEQKILAELESEPEHEVDGVVDAVVARAHKRRAAAEGRNTDGTRRPETETSAEKTETPSAEGESEVTAADPGEPTISVAEITVQTAAEEAPAPEPVEVAAAQEPEPAPPPAVVDPKPAAKAKPAKK